MTELTIIDLKRCIHCNSCIKACEMRHGIARFSHTGLQLNGRLILPQMCIQCDNLVCIEECKLKSKGIAREDGITYITDRCVGCGRCAKGCPYQAIEIVDVELLKERKKGILSRLFAKKNSDADETSKKPRRKANKCDLCRDYKNLACINECPTGAIQRVELFDLLETLDPVSAKKLLEFLEPAGASLKECAITDCLIIGSENRGWRNNYE